MHTIRDIARLATMLAGLIAPRLRLGFVSALPQLRLSYTSTTPHLRLDNALASISCEHCRSSCNNPHCAPRHVIYYCVTREKKFILHHTSKINVFPCCTRFFFYGGGGQAMDLFVPQGAIKYTLWPARRKIFVYTLIYRTIIIDCVVQQIKDYFAWKKLLICFLFENWQNKITETLSILKISYHFIKSHNFSKFSKKEM